MIDGEGKEIHAFFKNDGMQERVGFMVIDREYYMV